MSTQMLSIIKKGERFITLPELNDWPDDLFILFSFLEDIGACNEDDVRRSLDYLSQPKFTEMSYNATFIEVAADKVIIGHLWFEDMPDIMINKNEFIFLLKDWKKFLVSNKTSIYLEKNNDHFSFKI